MHRSIFSRLSTLALGAVIALAIASTDTAIGRSFSAAGRLVVDLYRLGSVWLHTAILAMPAALPRALSLAHEPEGTAHQRTWLIPGNAHMASMNTRPRIAIEPGWRMCPST